MRNKLLITSTLASALVFNSSANANLYEIAYNGNNTFTFQGQQFANLTDLGARIRQQVIAGAINLENDDIEFTAATQKQFANDLLTNTAGVADQFAPIIAAVGQVDVNSVRQYMTKAQQIWATLDQDEKDYLIDGFDLSDLGETDLEELAQFIDYAEQYHLTTQEIEAVDTQFNQVTTSLAQTDPALASLVNELGILKAAQNLSNEQLNRLLTVSQAIYANTAYTGVRNSDATQQTLKDFVDRIEAALNSTENQNLRVKGTADLATLTKTIDQFLVKNVTDVNAVPVVQKPDNAVTEGMLNSMLASRQVVDSRISGFSGASSGDLMQSYGVWLQGTMTRGTQKAYGKSTGYQFDQKGFTIGADTGDETMIGAAYTYMMNDIKNKTTSSNKEDVKAHLFTVYGKFDATNEIFVDGQLQYGKSQVKKKRLTNLAGNVTATAKPDATSMAGKAEVGYDYALNDQVHLVPTVGVSYTSVAVDSYTEKGNGLNRSVAKRTISRTSGIAGITAKYVADMGDMKLMPEIHANIDYAFKSKNPGTSVTVIDGVAPIITPSEKVAKGYYNLGASLKGVQSDMYEFSAGYDLGLSKKFQSHTGTLKLRINL